MDTKTLHIKQAFSEILNIYKAHFLFISGLVILIGLVSGILQYSGQSLAESSQYFLSALVGVIHVVLALVMGIGLQKICIKLSRGEQARFTDLFTNTRYLINTLVAVIVLILGVTVLTGSMVGLFMLLPDASALQVIIGLFAFCVFLFVMVRIYPWICFIIDRDSGPIECFVQSWNMTKGNFWNILGLVLLLSLAMMAVGFVVLGIFYAVPVVGGILGLICYLLFSAIIPITIAVIYRDLSILPAN